MNLVIEDHLGFSYVFNDFRCPLRIAELVVELLSGERQLLEVGPDSVESEAGSD